MNKRDELHKIFEEILGSKNVYFQPPENLKMKYPCIRYERSTANSIYGDNRPYAITDGYEVILIDKNPDSDYYRKIAELPKCRHERYYSAEGLNHDVFYLYY